MKRRTIMEEENPRSLFLKCMCHGHAIELTKYNDDKYIYLSFWKCGFETDTLWERIKIIWRLLKNGRVAIDDFVFDEYDCGELIDYLNDILENNKS